MEIRITSIGAAAFEDCSRLTSVTIPNSVTSIGYGAFEDCGRLTSVTIPDSVTSIGENAFYYCRGLTSIMIGNDVTSIGRYAFLGCSGLTSVIIPDSVTSIGAAAFSGCSRLTSITVGESNPNYASQNGLLYKKDITELICVPEAKKGAVVIPDSVTSIWDHAFSNCNGLTSVTIGNGVTSIGDDAFKSCSGLTSVTIGNGVTSIGDHAFRGCNGLTSITIPDSVTSIGESAFYECSNLANVFITDIAAWCRIVFSFTWEDSPGRGYPMGTYSNPLRYAKNLYLNGTLVNDLVIPNGVTSIGRFAFYGYLGLTSITIPDSVKSIGIKAFYCSSYYYNQNNWENGMLYAGNCLICADSSQRECVIKNGTKIISDGVFNWLPEKYIHSKNVVYNERLLSVTIPDSVTNIGSYAFLGCSGLTSVIIPDSVTSIGDDAFKSCSGLTSVTIGNGVTSIRDYAFGDCSGLTSVTIGYGVTSIGRYAFDYCRKLISVTFKNTNGWNVSEYSNMINAKTIPASDFAKLSTVAECLKSSRYYWKRS